MAVAEDDEPSAGARGVGVDLPLALRQILVPVGWLGPTRPLGRVVEHKLGGVSGARGGGEPSLELAAPLRRCHARGVEAHEDGWPLLRRRRR